MAERWPDRTEALRERMKALHERLEAELPAEDGTAYRMGSRWVAFRAAVTPAYEALSRKLQEHQFTAPTLRPTNYLRTFFHVMNAVVCIGIMWGMPSLFYCLAITVPLVGWAWTVEILRRSRPEMNARVMKFFGPIAHAYEYERINSATWYVTAILILNLTMSPLVAGIGLAVLGVGDPMSGLIGRRFGKTKIMHGRSVEGSLAFVLAATVAAFGAGFLFAPTLPIATLVALSLSGALAGAVAEIVSVRVDDNLSIGLASGTAALLMALALGVPLF
jgi:dolichol kinase